MYWHKNIYNRVDGYVNKLAQRASQFAPFLVDESMKLDDVIRVNNFGAWVKFADYKLDAPITAEQLGSVDPAECMFGELWLHKVYPVHNH